MSIYGEFAEAAERRRRRLLRQQYWLRLRCDWRRRRLLWEGLLALLLALAVAAFLAAELVHR